MKVLMPLDSDFKYDECKKLYEKNKKILNEESTFDEVINNTFFYSFYNDENELTLCVYFFKSEGKLWINGFGIRKRHLFNKECLLKALSWFNCDIWAKSVEKPAIYGIMICGFKKYKDDIYVYRQNT